jgi:hypothetical protein
MRRNMARQLKRLTARTVATTKKLGRHADGGNLYLTISKTGAGVSRRWTFLFSLNGRQREAGFGAVNDVRASPRRAGLQLPFHARQGHWTRWMRKRPPRRPRRRARRSANAPMNS